MTPFSSTVTYPETPKDDGLSDGYNTVQGVRTYDPQAGVWNTPDAYRGDVHDPMSQKPFMWNRNNPYEYSDPSGFNPLQDWWEKLQDAVTRTFHHTNVLSVSPGLLKDMNPRITRTNNVINNNLTPSTVGAAIREAGGGMKVAKSGGGYFDHVSKVQEAVNGINKTLNHIETMEAKYANSPQDSQALQVLKQSYQAAKDSLRQEFQAAGVEKAIKW